MLSDDFFQNEFDIMRLNTNIYLNFEELDKAKGAYKYYKDYLILYSENNNRNLDVQIEALNTLIQRLENWSIDGVFSVDSLFQ